MKMPLTPPDLANLQGSIASDQLARAFGHVAGGSTQEYFHWDKLIHLTPPGEFSSQAWWLAVKLARQARYKTVPLTDWHGRPFRFLITDPMPEQLHYFDLHAAGNVGVPLVVTDPASHDRFYMSALIEEAITSSQLEGATTTREVAKDMIRAGRSPMDRSERMILNNFRTMQRIDEVKREPLSEELIFEIHRLVTEGTLDEATASGRFRRPDENIVVSNTAGEVFHTPPPSGELGPRMASLCDFANARTPDGFIHPVLRSMILHFWLAYDHPFVDGNGRTARALFYWSMLHYGFWLTEFISISSIIRRAPLKYARAFLYTETDENDLTYFLLYHTEVLRQAFDALYAYIERKAGEMAAVQDRVRTMALLNVRQRDLINHALRHPRALYTTEGHRLSHNVAYQTARNDLMDLANRGLLTVTKPGKTSYFAPAADLEARLAKLD
jgi:Fic family protein